MMSKMAKPLTREKGRSQQVAKKTMKKMTRSTIKVPKEISTRE